MPIWDDKPLTNRRQSKRMRFVELVGYQLKDAVHFGGCRAVDISETGIRLLLNDFIPLNGELFLRIQLATQVAVECIGRIAWVAKFPFGENYQSGLELINNGTILQTRRSIHELIISNA